MNSAISMLLIFLPNVVVDIPPFETFFLIDNEGDFLITNDGDRLITN